LTGAAPHAGTLMAVAGLQDKGAPGSRADAFMFNTRRSWAFTMRSPNETTALVTGATSGIGKATATGLAKWGARVTLVARNPAKGEQTISDIRAKVPGARLELLQADLSDQHSIRAAAARFLSRNEELHILVNAAGVFLPKRIVTADGLEATFATNYVAYFLLTNLLLPALKRGAPSRVVNVSSRYGVTKIDFDDMQMERRKYSYFKSTAPRWSRASSSRRNWPSALRARASWPILSTRALWRTPSSLAKRPGSSASSRT